MSWRQALRLCHPGQRSLQRDLELRLQEELFRHAVKLILLVPKAERTLMQFLLWHCFFCLRYYGSEQDAQVAEPHPLGTFFRPLKVCWPPAHCCICVGGFGVDNQWVLHSPFRELGMLFSETYRISRPFSTATAIIGITEDTPRGGVCV